MYYMDIIGADAQLTLMLLVQLTIERWTQLAQPPSYRCALLAQLTIVVYYWSSWPVNVGHFWYHNLYNRQHFSDICCT